MSKHNKTTLLFPLAAAFALASPAVFAQSHGVGAGAGVNASAAARVPTQMPAQASAGMEMRGMQRAEPQQKATPAVPATPATPAVPASQSEDGQTRRAEPATPGVKVPAGNAAQTGVSGAPGTQTVPWNTWAELSSAVGSGLPAVSTSCCSWVASAISALKATASSG